MRAQRITKYYHLQGLRDPHHLTCLSRCEKANPKKSKCFQVIQSMPRNPPISELNSYSLSTLYFWGNPTGLETALLLASQPHHFLWCPQDCRGYAVILKWDIKVNHMLSFLADLYTPNLENKDKMKIKTRWKRKEALISTGTNEVWGATISFKHHTKFTRW